MNEDRALNWMKLGTLGIIAVNTSNSGPGTFLIGLGSVGCFILGIKFLLEKEKEQEQVIVYE